MFEAIDGLDARPVSNAELAAFVGRLAESGTVADDAERIDRIRLLEAVKSAAAADQALTTAAFASSQRATQQAAGVRGERVGQGIAAQVALARRESPARAARYTGWAGVLVRELPGTFAVLQRGETTEWRAMIVARETIWLSRDQRATVDTELSGRLAELGDRQVEVEAKKLAYRLDPHGFLARSRAAERDRRVSLRPAPDTMTRLSALLPAAQGVAAYAALARAADTLRAGGDQRGRGQVMADTLVERVTGQAVADGVPVEIHLVMTDHTLFKEANPAADQPASPDREHHANPADPPDASEAADNAAATHDSGDAETVDAGDVDGADDAGDVDVYDADDPGGVDDAGGVDEPAHLVGYGPVPAGLARHLARGTYHTTVWVRRLYRDPTGQLAAIDARRRVFDGPIRRAVIVRDQVCRTPWCGAPIRHADHARPVADGGVTSLENGQGLCEACNYAKQAFGWTTEPGPHGAGQSVITTTPTGHTYASRAPDLPGRPHAQTGPRAGPAPPATATEHAA